MSISCYPVSVVTLVRASRRHANSVQLGTKVSTRISSVGRPSGRKEGRSFRYFLPPVVRLSALGEDTLHLVQAAERACACAARCTSPSPLPRGRRSCQNRPVCLRRHCVPFVCHIPRTPELLIGYRDDQSDIATSSRFADRLSVIVLELCERYLHGSVVVCENCFWQLVSFGSLP